MARIIKLPSGVTLDLEQGEIRTPLGPGPVPMNRNPHVSSGISSYPQHRSLWRRYSDFIGRIGDWIADHSESITSVIATLCAVGGGVLFVVWLFSLGLFWGIIAAIVLGGLVFYALMAMAGILMWAGNIALGVVRYIFFNGWTFLITVILVTVFNILSAVGSGGGDGVAVTPESAPAQETVQYVCTAGTLNIRSMPDTGSDVLGVIYRGDTVNVVGKTGKFAIIEYEGNKAYAAIKYLHEVEITQTVESEKP